jgi:serine/threonine protein phosphatase 1
MEAAAAGCGFHDGASDAAMVRPGCRGRQERQMQRERHPRRIAAARAPDGVDQPLLGAVGRPLGQVRPAPGDGHSWRQRRRCPPHLRRHGPTCGIGGDQSGVWRHPAIPSSTADPAFAARFRDQGQPAGGAREALRSVAMINLRLAPASLPPGQRVYAIGDVHGCDDRLGMMHRLIASDLAARPAGKPTIVHLGDAVDRGEDSAQVIERMILPWPKPTPRFVHLLGNHEAMMLEAVETGTQEAAEQWLANGGGASLDSWGVPRRAKPRDWVRFIPQEHMAFLRGLTVRHTAGGYVFVHAGLRPGVPLERQSRHDMIWIREPFLSWQGELPGVVVHGHTPEADPVVRPNRIGVDTGVVLGGVLTCVVLEENRMGFLHA